LNDDRVQQVKQANDIVEVVGSYLPLQPQGSTFKGLCPFHDDRRPSFDVDPRRQRYRCWSCGKHGDVISFVQEHEKVSFTEALELLARRAGIVLEKNYSAPHAAHRARMFDVARWVAQQFHDCLLEAPLAEEARRYLGTRGLIGETVRGYGLGYAPRPGTWLLDRARAAQVSLETLEQVGLVAPRTQGPGHYDRFRDRVIFPIRDVRGQVVGFGGRILPNSPLADRAPKYYNSCDTPLFSKSEHLYGLDQARHEASRIGYLAVVEGYTDVLMAHQRGIKQVVATLGTALNARHVRQLRRFVPRVVLVFDADSGGATGVDRALQIFASQDVELAIAALPEGMDPCDLLVKQGAGPFVQAIEQARDALAFKLEQMLPGGQALGIEEQRRAVDAVLRIIALAPRLAGQAGAVKTELMVSCIAHRVGLREETVWARLQELRQQRPAEHDWPGQESNQSEGSKEDPQATGENGKKVVPGKAPPEERELLAVLLAHATLVAQARSQVQAGELSHPIARHFLECLYALHDEGKPATLEQMRGKLQEPALMDKAIRLQEMGQGHADPVGWLTQILARFATRRAAPVKQELRHQLQAEADHAKALDLLRRLQNRVGDPDPDHHGEC
jgi:DNA primase